MSADPVPIDVLLGELMRVRGWSRRLDAARVQAQWEAVVGPAVADHCRPVQLRNDGTLEVATDSAAWATQLSYLRGTLLDRLGQVCGPGLVTAVQVRPAQGRRSR